MEFMEALANTEVDVSTIDEATSLTYHLTLLSPTLTTAALLRLKGYCLFCCV
jgi:hypothetical protein